MLLLCSDNLVKLAEIFEKRANINYDAQLFQIISELLSIKIPKEDFKEWADLNYINLKEPLSKSSGLFYNTNLLGADWIKYNNEYFVYYGKSYPSDNAGAECFLSKNKHLPDNITSNNFRINSQIILKGYKQIPNLFITAGIQFYTEPAHIIPLNVAHNMFIIDIISKVLGVDYYKNNKEIITFFNEFIKNNKKPIDSIRSFLTTTNPKILGSGADGVALDIGNKKILKIFRDSVAFNKAKEAVHRLHKMPLLSKTEAMIYDIGEFSLENLPESIFISHSPIYYYIMEKVKPISAYHHAMEDALQNILSTISEFIDFTKHIWKPLKEKINNPIESEKIKNEVEYWSNKLIQSGVISQFSIREVESSSLGELSEDWLQHFVEEVMIKYISGRGDLHMGNIGITSYGKLKYFDPAYSGWESTINV